VRVKDFAPHLAGRMLPGMFDYLGIGKVERFPGDPYAHQEPWAAWFWMHTTECGSPNHIGSWSDRQMGAYRFIPTERWSLPEADFVSVPAPHRAKPTPPKAVVADDRPSVGSMGARQPADAGPQRELFAEAS
jgi:hypothetical protein